MAIHQRILRHLTLESIHLMAALEEKITLSDNDESLCKHRTVIDLITVVSKSGERSLLHPHTWIVCI